MHESAVTVAKDLTGRTIVAAVMSTDNGSVVISCSDGTRLILKARRDPYGDDLELETYAVAEAATGVRQLLDEAFDMSALLAAGIITEADNQQYVADAELDRLRQKLHEQEHRRQSYLKLKQEFEPADPVTE